MGERAFTPKQEAFIAWYCKLLNATRAAQRAGYGDDDTTHETYGSIGSNLLQNVRVRAEIDKRLRDNLPSPGELLSRIGEQATVDLAPYIRADGTVDVDALNADGLGHVIDGSKPGRNGPELSFTSPQAAQKMLATYHKLLGADVQVDVTASVDIGTSALDALAAQLRAAASADSVTPDSVGDDDSTE